LDMTRNAGRGSYAQNDSDRHGRVLARIGPVVRNNDSHHQQVFADVGR